MQRSVTYLARKPLSGTAVVDKPSQSEAGLCRVTCAIILLLVLEHLEISVIGQTIVNILLVFHIRVVFLM